MAEQEKEYMDRATEEAQRATAEYEKRYNPPAAAVDAYKRAMTRQLRENYGQQRESERSYSDLYQQARRQATRMGGMSDVSGFSGGMRRGRDARISAAEIRALSGIAGQRESALRALGEQRQAISSNALLEAQQAEQYDRAVRAQRAADYQSVLETIGKVKTYADIPADKKGLLKTQYGISDQASLERFLNMSPEEFAARAPGGQSGISPIAQLLPPVLLARLATEGYAGLADLLQGQRMGTTFEDLGLFQDMSPGAVRESFENVYGVNTNASMEERRRGAEESGMPIMDEEGNIIG
jgi:hypothetical protein